VAKVQVSVQIAAPPKVVWAAIEDIAGHVDWMSEAVAIRFTSPNRRGVGTTFDCDTKVGPFRTTDRMEITEWVPGKVMGVAHAGVVTGAGRFTLKRRRGGTRFAWDERLRFPWYVGGPITAAGAAPVLRRIWKRNLRRLKAQVEGQRS
jgi:uncharacterized protein YndB with AHSA1/START domain